jgi:hypothetical protein
MTLNVTDEQAAVLREVLDITLRDLSHEIAATDRADYRHMLRARRDALRVVLDALGGPIALAERYS